jgi:hypothetical protein
MNPLDSEIKPTARRRMPDAASTPDLYDLRMAYARVIGSIGLPFDEAMQHPVHSKAILSRARMLVKRRLLREQTMTDTKALAAGD